MKTERRPGWRAWRRLVACGLVIAALSGFAPCARAEEGETAAAVPSSAPPITLATLLERPTIEWRLENPFRLFLDSTTTELHQQAYEELDATQRAHPILEIEHKLAGRFARGWAESAFHKVCWDADRNQYGCRQIQDYFSPRSHRVLVSLKSYALPEPPADTQGHSVPVRCEWRQTPLGGKRSAVAGCGVERRRRRRVGAR